MEPVLCSRHSGEAIIFIFHGCGFNPPIGGLKTYHTYACEVYFLLPFITVVSSFITVHFHSQQLFIHV